MSLFSENKTPWLTLVQQQAQPGQPAAGLFRLFLSAANKLQLIDSTGTVVNAATDGTNGTNGTDGIDGLPGVDGTNGTNGTNGVGVPAGGTTGQALVKNSNADYDTKWSAVAASGGGGGGGGGGSGASGASVPLTYVSNGDTNGLFYFIGQSLTGSWQNPQGMGTGQVTFAAYPAGIGANNGSIGDLTGRNGSGFYLNQASPNGLQIDIGPGRALNPNNVSIQNRNGYDGTALQNVNLYGSQDGVNFTLLGNLPVNLNLQSSWATCAVAAQDKAFRYFRLLQNGNNNAGTTYFCCGQVEIYGTLYVGSSSGSSSPQIVQSVFGRGNSGFNITLPNPPQAGNTLIYLGFGFSQAPAFPAGVVFIGGGVGYNNNTQALWAGMRVAAAGEAATNWQYNTSNQSFNGAIIEVSGVGGLYVTNYGLGPTSSTDVGAYIGAFSAKTLKINVFEWDNAVLPTATNLPPNLLLQNQFGASGDGGNHYALLWAYVGPGYMSSVTVPGINFPNFLGVECSGM